MDQLNNSSSRLTLKRSSSRRSDEYELPHPHDYSNDKYTSNIPRSDLNKGSDHEEVLPTTETLHLNDNYSGSPSDPCNFREEISVGEKAIDYPDLLHSRRQSTSSGDSEFSTENSLETQRFRSYIQHKLQYPFCNFTYVIDDSLQTDYDLDNWTDTMPTVWISRNIYNSIFRTILGNSGSTNSALEVEKLRARNIKLQKEFIIDIEAYLAEMLFCGKMTYTKQVDIYNQLLIDLCMEMEHKS